MTSPNPHTAPDADASLPQGDHPREKLRAYLAAEARCQAHEDGLVEWEGDHTWADEKSRLKEVKVEALAALDAALQPRAAAAVEPAGPVSVEARDRLLKQADMPDDAVLNIVQFPYPGRDTWVVGWEFSVPSKGAASLSAMAEIVRLARPGAMDVEALRVAANGYLDAVKAWVACRWRSETPEGGMGKLWDAMDSAEAELRTALDGVGNGGER